MSPWLRVYSALLRFLSWNLEMNKKSRKVGTVPVFGYCTSSVGLWPGLTSPMWMSSRASCKSITRGLNATKYAGVGIWNSLDVLRTWCNSWPVKAQAQNKFGPAWVEPAWVQRTHVHSLAHNSRKHIFHLYKTQNKNRTKNANISHWHQLI
jgi:hypothetical protein